MTTRHWERARAVAIGAVVVLALVVGALYAAPMPPETLASPSLPPPGASAPDEAEVDLIAADQARGMKALDGILEARMRLEAEAAGVDPVLPADGVRHGGDDEALLVAWGEAFRAIGIEDLAALDYSQVSGSP